MNITLEKTDELNAVLKVEVLAEDYSSNVEKVLKENQKKMNLPGFRPGKIPFSLVNKMYGKALMLDEINKMVIDSIYKYLEENNIEILGNPMPNREKENEINWETQTNFEFSYDLALCPQFNLEPLEKMEAPYYDIVVEDKEIEKYKKETLKRYGSFINPETAEEDDIIYMDFQELNETGEVKENGINHKSSVSLDLLKKPEVKKIFTGLKKDDTVKLDMMKTFEEEREVAYLLGVDAAKVKEIKSEFNATVVSISRNIPANIDDEFFAKVYKNETIKSEEQFIENLKKEIQTSYQVESDKNFVNSVVEQLIKGANITLPEAFLKRWLVESNKEKFTDEIVEKEFPIYAETLKWQIIENKIFKEYKIEVTQNDVKEYIRDYFKKTIPSNVDNEALSDQRLNEIVERMLQNKEETKRIYDRLYDVKTQELFTGKIKMKKKSVTFEEFIKLISEKHNHEHEHEH